MGKFKEKFEELYLKEVPEDKKVISPKDADEKLVVKKPHDFDNKVEKPVKVEKPAKESKSGTTPIEKAITNDINKTKKISKDLESIANKLNSPDQNGKESNDLAINVLAAIRTINTAVNNRM